MTKILLACPISDHKEYIIYEWLEYLKKLETEFDILLVDNSHTIDFSIKITRLGYKVIRVEPFKNDPNKNKTMAKCMEIIRLYALAGNYDYFFSLECDVFPPVHIINTLYKTKLEKSDKEAVIGATYFIDQGEYSRLMIQRIEPDKPGSESIVRNLTIDESFLFCNGQVKYAFGIGFGCVLIHRATLEKITFRTEPGSQLHADSIFYKDLYALKIPVLVHTGIICHHINQDWGIIINKEKQIQS
jgi:hypothetical protein